MEAGDHCIHLILGNVARVEAAKFNAELGVKADFTGTRDNGVEGDVGLGGRARLLLAERWGVGGIISRFVGWGRGCIRGGAREIVMLCGAGDTVRGVGIGMGLG